MDIHAVEELLSSIMLLGVLGLEIFGAFIILFSATVTFVGFLRTGKVDHQARLTFSRFLIFGLEFKLAGEILRTVIVRTVNEIIILAAIIALRAVLNFIIHWEIRREKRDRDEEN